MYITDDNGSHKYEIFAAYEVSTAGTTYQIGFSGDASKQAFLDYCLGQSVIDTGITPTVHDKILTLSTCTGNGHATRWVVQARLKGVAPSDSAAEAAGIPRMETTPPGRVGTVETTPEETVPSAEPPQTPTQPQDQGAGEAPSAAVDPQEPVNGAQTQDPSRRQELHRRRRMLRRHLKGTNKRNRFYLQQKKQLESLRRSNCSAGVFISKAGGRFTR